MLFWESLDASRYVPPQKKTDARAGDRNLAIENVRLPFDRRCRARTKAGDRCRGRIRAGSDFCIFHDPAMTAERKRNIAAKAAQSRRRLMRLPDGYLRKLTSMAAVGEGMDRLYREVRLGLITPEMGSVLFDILTRLMDAGLVSCGPRPDRTKAARVRPKLRELLTRREKIAWKRAVESAVEEETKATSLKPRRRPTKSPFTEAVTERTTTPRSAVPVPLSFQTAS